MSTELNQARADLVASVMNRPNAVALLADTVRAWVAASPGAYAYPPGIMEAVQRLDAVEACIEVHTGEPAAPIRLEPATPAPCVVVLGEIPDLADCHVVKIITDA